MTTFSNTLDRLGSFLNANRTSSSLAMARPTSRGAGPLHWATITIVLGFAMMIAGLGMTATIVLLPLGVMTGLLGVAVFAMAFVPRSVRPNSRRP